MTLAPRTELPVVGDVGFAGQDEVDVVQKGRNYGWPCFEGNTRGPGAFPDTAACRALYLRGPKATESPLIAYDHDNSASITGGAFYDGTRYPQEFRGVYFYADFAYGWLRYAKLDEEGALLGAPADFATDLPGPVAMHVGPDGRLYYLSLPTGELRRLDVED